MKYLACVLFLAVAAFGFAAEDEHNCPMHAQHTAAAHNDAAAKTADASHFDAVNQRGDKAMGFDHLKTTHHFLLAKDGGAIEVQANSADDKTSIEQIRRHLEHISHAFAAGDFDIPMFVHSEVPPGVETMKRLRAQIGYEFQSMPAGARVAIKTANADARRAVWDFLRFQITDHQTGDPLTARE